jgi:single-strand DNA-binding protein
MTVSGWVATDPKLVLSASGVNMCTFRLASTSRYLDRTKNEWVDGQTEWFSVRVFRAAATMVHDSVAKGQPVTVVGRFKTNEWQAGDDTRKDLVLDATSVGHDLTRGVATFRRAIAADNDAEPRPSADGPDHEPPLDEAAVMEVDEIEADDFDTADVDPDEAKEPTAA